MRNRIKEKSKLLLFTVGMIALLGIGSTFSFLKLEVEKTNNLTAHNTDVEIKEKFPDKIIPLPIMQPQIIPPLQTIIQPGIRTMQIRLETRMKTT